MWAIALQVLAVLAGWQVIRQLPFTWSRLEAVAASAVVGYMLTTWLCFLAALAFGWSVGLPIAVTLAILATAISWWRLPRRAVLQSKQLVANPFWRVVGWLVAAGTAGVIGYITCWSYGGVAADGTWWSNGNVWGDLPVHVSFITQFGNGDRLDLTSPLYKRIPLAYPLMADLWSGILWRVSSSWTASLLVPSLVISAALLRLIFSFSYRFTQSVRAAWMAWLMVVFSGPLHGGVVLVSTLALHGWQAYVDFVGSSIAHATSDGYMNFWFSHLLPQRAFLWGFPLFLVIATGLLETFRHHQAGRRARFTGIGIGLLAGLMPLVHTQSFLVLIGTIGLAVLLLIIQRRPVPVAWRWLMATTAIVAIPQLVWQFTAVFDGAFSHWIFGWKVIDFSQNESVNWFVYWTNSVGWLFVLLLTGWMVLQSQRAKREVWLVYLAAVSIFAICNVYVFQPTLWDNMKFFEYAFCMLMLVSATVFDHWWRSRWGRLAVSGLMVSLCTAGFFTLVLSAPGQNYQLLSADDVTFGTRLRQELPPSAYLLVGDRHNHPVIMLSDHKVLMSYAGWYVNYGSDWVTTYGDRMTMLGGGDGATELIKSYGLDFVVMSDDEVIGGVANLSFFQEHFALFKHELGWWVFDLRQPL